MDSQELEQAWNEVCLTIKTYNSIESSQVDAFFSRLKPQAMSDGFLMLTADNDFIRNWIGTHYLGVIKNALFDIYQIPFNVLIEVDPTQGQTSSPSPVSQNMTMVEGSTPAPQPVINTETPVVEDFNKTEEPVKVEITPDDSMIKAPSSSYTFENFVIGDSNRMAYHMAVSVAEMPGKTQRNNPLFIYGKSGLGKTHLLRAIQNYIEQNMPELKVLYVDSEELVSDYMEASVAHDKEKSSYKKFKERYEQANVLLIDDVQHLQGKKQTLDIIFQIFNKLSSRGSQIVLSADRAPKNIDIDERYQSRFNQGGTIDIQPPEVETKMGIIKEFIEEYKETSKNTGLEVPYEIQTYIAENSGSNVRELKSAINKVILQMEYFNQPNIGLTDVKQLLENHFSGGLTTRITIADIQKAVESFYKISHADLISKKKTREVAYARQIAFFLSRQMTDLPFNDIGKQFSRDHSTVMYAVSNIETKMKENREVREEIDLLRKSILEA